MGRRSRPVVRVDRDPAAQDLEARLAGLRDEIGRIEAELAETRGSGRGASWM